MASYDNQGNKLVKGGATSLFFGSTEYPLHTSISDGDVLANVGGTVKGLPRTFGENLIINGGGDYFQRQVPGTLTSVSDASYGPDRWKVMTQTASVQSQRTSGNRAVNAIRLKQNQAAAQRMGLAQIVENVVSQPYRSRAAKLSFAVNISNSQAVRYAVLEWTSTADSVTSDIVNDWTSSTYTASNFFIASITATVGSTTPSASTWTTCTLDATLGSSCNNLIVFIWTEGTAAQNVTMDVSEVVLVDGAVTPTWVPRPPAHELVLCQRYYEKTYNFESAPGENTTTGLWQSFSPHVNQCNGGIFKVSKRVAPTMVIYSKSGTTAKANDINYVDVGTSVTGSDIGVNGYRIVFDSGSGFTAGTAFSWHYTADAEL